jgi:hypothetical protein
MKILKQVLEEIEKRVSLSILQCEKEIEKLQNSNKAENISISKVKRKIEFLSTIRDIHTVVQMLSRIEDNAFTDFEDKIKHATDMVIIGMTLDEE